MSFQVSRTDTGQYVLIDPLTDTVVIDDDLAAGFAKLEQVVVDKPAVAATPVAGPAGADPATQGSSAFGFRGGPRYAPILLAVVLPFAWLAVLYFALANLLAEVALDRGAAEHNAAKLVELEREVQSLRSEVAGAPRTGKTKPKARPKPKPKPTPTVTPDGDDDEQPAPEPGADEPDPGNDPR